MPTRSRRAGRESSFTILATRTPCSERSGDVRGRTARPRVGPIVSVTLAFDEADVAGARPFLRLFDREFHALTFAKQLEHGASHRAAVKEVLDSALVADEPKPFVDQEPCDSPGWHNRSLRSESRGRSP